MDSFELNKVLGALLATCLLLLVMNFTANALAGGCSCDQVIDVRICARQVAAAAIKFDVVATAELAG